jgi:uncharacterized membrane protein
VIRWARRRLAGTGGEDGQMVVLFIGLIVLVLMTGALWWDTSNWFLGHRALNNLADGAAVAAGNDLDTQAYYRSEGRDLRLLGAQASGTVRAYMADAAGDSGVRGVRVVAVTVSRDVTGPTVTVQLAAPPQVAFMGPLRIVLPDMEATATATAVGG